MERGVMEWTGPRYVPVSPLRQNRGGKKLCRAAEPVENIGRGFEDVEGVCPEELSGAAIRQCM